jgi:hypothetical protein
MTLEETIKLKIARLDDIPNAYTDGIKKTQKDIMEKLLDSLEMLKRDESGNIKKTQANLIVIEDIVKDLEKIFTRSDYIKITKEFINEFSVQAQITDSFFTKTFGDFDDNKFNEIALNKSKAQAYELMAGLPYVTTYLYNPVKSLLTDAIISGDSYVKTVKAIKQVVQGGTIKDKKLEGKLYRYAKQMAYDTFAVADRGYTNNISLDLDIEWYVYRGGLVEDSRSFCISRNDKYFHREEVKSWGKLGNWDGKIPSTDEKTIFIYAGGYRCNHSILPTSIAAVPKDVIQRNIDNGNYKPSEKEKEVLGVS